MHPTTKSLLTPDFEAHPAEDDLRHLVGGCPGVEEDLVCEARAAGVSWQTIFALMVQYGPLFVQALQTFLAALRHEPPQPLPETPGGPEAAQETAPQARKGRRHAAE